MTTLAANFDAAVAAVQSAVPSAKIIVFGPATPTGTQANLTTVKTTVQGRCTALGLTFVDVDNWVSNNNKSLYTAGDNVHPTQVGYDYIATRRGLTKALIRCLAAKSAVRAVSCSSP